MKEYHKNNISYRNKFLLIALIIFSIIKLGKSSSENNKNSKNTSKNSFRKLLTGNDIVKKIEEQCTDNSNILKYNIVLNSTAFLYNLEASSKRNLLSSIKELDGKTIGVEQGKTFSDLIKINFPNSEILYSDSPNSLILDLLKSKIDAFLIEEIVAKYWTNELNVITIFKNKISNDSYAFGLFNRNKWKNKSWF